MDDAVTVALEGRPESAGLFGPLPAAGRRRALRPLREPRFEHVGGQVDLTGSLVLHNVTGLTGSSGSGSPGDPSVAQLAGCRLLQDRLRGRQPGQGHPVWTAAHVV